MFSNIGQKIRASRKEKGIALNELASKLGVSRGYLSNIETGKTDTIHFSTLEKLQKEFSIFPADFINSFNPEMDFDMRLKNMNHLLHHLHLQNPQKADYLITIVEQGFDLLCEADPKTSINK